MSHMVIYRGADGKPGYHQTDEIIDAVAFVERLRNEQSVEHARIFRLEEVQFEFRPYYRVELTGGADRMLGAADRRAVPSAERDVDDEVTPDPELTAASNPFTSSSDLGGEPGGEEVIGARRGLFGR